MPANDSYRIPNKTRDEARREFVKKMAYVAPALLTLPVSPQIAQTGSAPNPCTGFICPPNHIPFVERDINGNLICSCQS